MEQKLEWLKKYKSIDDLIKDQKFVKVVPNKKNDWINQGDPDFDKFMVIGRRNGGAVFNNLDETLKKMSNK